MSILVAASLNFEVYLILKSIPTVKLLLSDDHTNNSTIVRIWVRH